MELRSILDGSVADDRRHCTPALFEPTETVFPPGQSLSSSAPVAVACERLYVGDKGLSRDRTGETRMGNSQWHRIYTADVAAPPAVLFDLLADLPRYDEWLPSSEQFLQTTDVEPYPVRLGSRYHDGQPGIRGKDWWGTVTGFQPPGSLDFQHTIAVNQLRATVDVHIHYSFEREKHSTRISRWLVLDIAMPAVFRPMRNLITERFDSENVRTMNAVKEYTESHA
jgi:hypothetical protein